MLRGRGTRAELCKQPNCVKTVGSSSKRAQDSERMARSGTSIVFRGANSKASHYPRHCQSAKLANICDTDFFNTIDPLRSLQHECFNVCFW